ncbi:MAG TPA: aminotransferase class I/II-fold pyridoxal phosphate-dependent enzyme [Pseudonocardiaceae bacterium]|nr:aminotransferase class I/II-fold pyridoxal phosphate-dependent enzyme [Pseudonocardiaceae bacterium]
MTGIADRAGPLSHALRWQRGVVQDVAPPNVIDLSPGYLEPALLPVDLVRAAYSTELARFGAAALSYGENRGVTELRDLLAQRLGTNGEHLLLTGGTSQALHLIGTTLAAPGQVVLVEALSYDFGRRILLDCGLRVREFGDGPDELDEALRRAKAGGEQVAFVYLNPTFHNPTGTTMPLRHRERVLDVLARHRVAAVEDSAYDELDLDGLGVPPALGALAGYRGVIQLGTFAKTLAPGLRLGWLVAAPEVTEQLATHGLLLSGGSPNHTTALAVSGLVRDGGYDRHVGWLRARLRDRRDALVAALDDAALADVDFAAPAGGFFVWLRSRGSHTEQDLLDAAADAGVRVAAGSRFGTATTPSIRLAYSFNPPDRLAAGATALAAALTGKPSDLNGVVHQ